MEMKEKLEDNFIFREGKKLRFGYTTGSCAAAASKAAARMLLTGELIPQVNLLTPAGVSLQLEVLDSHCFWQEKETGEKQSVPEAVSCAIRKEAGDDPDVTDGVLIYASVCKSQEEGIHLVGGEGVGKVTRPGLDQPVGAWAINRVPRQMILTELQQICRSCDYLGGLEVTISVPQGMALAEKTFNPRLGIEGGISILGTSGMVVPMSEDALVKTISLEMRQLVDSGEEALIITPGNYGRQFVEQRMKEKASLQCSNYVGQTLDMAVQMGVKKILFVAHLGKFIKVAGGIMNTHSRESDSRMEILASCVLLAGGSGEQARQILDMATTEEAVAYLEQQGQLEKTMEIVRERILYYMDKRVSGQVELDVILFTNQKGRLV